MAHLLLRILLPVIIPIFGCQTIHKSDSQENKQADILQSQKAMIINFLNQGVPVMAHRELRRIINLHPKDPDLQNLMGLTQLAMEKPSQAARYFLNSHKLSPRTSVVLNLSSAYIESAQYQKAIQLLMNERKSPHTENYQFPERITHNIGLAAERSQNLRMAEKYYRLALNENPNYYLSLMRLGQTLEKLKKPFDSQKVFIRAKAACPKCYDPVNAVAMSFVSQGKYGSAYKTLSQFTKQTEITDEDKAKAKKLMGMVKKIARSKRSKKNTNIAGSKISPNVKSKKSKRQDTNRRL